ncbi:3'-5' exonuclease [Clostridium paridis]|uniref:DNA 3'-5' helicase n=1 Tax=Clostridium paridis TaxID=2803863 RepID=A0A937K5X5_9CLOT|nr:3'-5' exonuclease [Clostridium paridis]MBL4933073.1 UvrD-helicase domain-containing protein [Clostridium paridis]
MDLNYEQNLLINEQERNIILLASAGTGKTDALSKRIADIISKGKAKASDILCITFTNKASKEMKERIEKIVGTEAKNITVKTFHSFCFDILKMEVKKKTDIFSDFIIFDEDDCKDIIKSCNYFDFSIYQLQRFIEIVKLVRVNREIFSDDLQKDYKEAVVYLINENKEKLEEICTERGEFNSKLMDFLIEKGHILVNSYNSLLYNNHGLDFIDLIAKTKELFNNNEVVEALRNKYKYINIDEVQDTSLLEYSIIEKLFEGNNVLICGDVFQTIYKWRGSEPSKIFKSFREKYDPLEIVFSVNYRASKNLTEASLKFLQNAFPIEMKDLYKEGIKAKSQEEGEKIIIKPNSNIREEAKFILNEVKELERRNIDISKACILTRDNRYNINLSQYLRTLTQYEALNFEFILVDQFKFFRRQEIKDIIAFLKLVGNRYDSVSLKRILKRLPTGVGDKTFEIIESEEYKKVGISLTDFVDEDVLKFGEKYSLLIEEFNNDNIVVFDVESTGVDVTEDEIIQIAAIKIDKSGEVIDVFERFFKNNKSVKDSEHVHGFSDEFLRENGGDRGEVLKEFIKFSEGTVIVGHNVQYDINILTSELTRLSLGKPGFKTFYDTLDIYRRFYPNTINHKLETLSKIFKTKHIPSHDAMDDILATKDLLVRAIETDIIPTSLDRVSLINKHIKSFSNISQKINKLFSDAEYIRPYDIVGKIVNDFNLKTLYSGDAGKEKIERMKDFYVLLRELDDKEKSNRDSLIDIIKLTSLSNGELEGLIVNRTKKARIPIITVHQAKGLEYETVFIAGVQDNTFPSYMAIKNNNIDEEKRTFYVAITRAKKRLYITTSIMDRDKRSFINLVSPQFVD